MESSASNLARAAHLNGASETRIQSGPTRMGRDTDQWAAKAQQLKKDIYSISDGSYYFTHRKPSTPSSASQLQDYFAEVARHVHPRVSAGVLSYKYNLQSMIMAGEHTAWENNAQLMMKTIIQIGRDAEETGLHQELAAQILAADYAVFQLARQGQARAAWREIRDFTPRNTARVFDAEMALFGLLRHLPTQAEKRDVLAAFGALDFHTRAGLADPQSKRINVRQNYYFLRDAGFDFEAQSEDSAYTAETTANLRLAHG